MPLKKQPQPDGRKAYLPHPFFRNCIFGLSDNAKRLSGGILRQDRLNKWGDRLRIESFTPIRIDDMGIFLAAIALYQKSMSSTINTPVSPTHTQPMPMKREANNFPTLSNIVGMFSASDLYYLTGRTSKKLDYLKNRLWALGSIDISIKYADPSKHGNIAVWERAGLWRYSYLQQRGRAGGTFTLNPIDELIPREKYLWADAELCNRLKSDTAKALFWALICRQHLRASAPELQRICGSEGARPRDFLNRRLLPAFDELRTNKYTIVHNPDNTFSLSR